MMKGVRRSLKTRHRISIRRLWKALKKNWKNMTGGNYRPVSFASEKNVNVDSVQFIMKTEKHTCFRKRNS